jgi:hypothetical protein
MGRPEEWDAKSRNVDRVLRSLSPKSVVDIGCNRGWFSSLAVQAGADVVALDVDETNLADMYGSVRSSGASILPLVLDICQPTPRYHPGHLAVSTRLRGELAMALAVTHHLVFKRYLTFPGIAERLSEFTSRWLLVEFVPPSDRYVSQWMTDEFAWYRQHAFVEALGRYFGRIDVIESAPEPRVLFLCDRDADGGLPGWGVTVWNRGMVRPEQPRP